MKIVDFILKSEANEKIKYLETPNMGGELQPDTVIIHYTAGRDRESSVRTLRNPNVKASAHLVVGRDGGIDQLAPFNRIAWHAGKSSYKLEDGTTRIGYNKYSIGVEIDNAGVLTKTGEQYVSWFGRSYPQEEVFFGTHRNESVAKYWHRYTENQIRLVEEICELLVEEYSVKYILGHEEISPNRKIDPGPAFPLDKMRMRVLNPDRDQDEEEDDLFPAAGIVSASSLNIRSQPSPAGEKVAKPLALGKPVKILEESDGWYRVHANIEGWVSKQYIDVKK